MYNAHNHLETLPRATIYRQNGETMERRTRPELEGNYLADDIEMLAYEKKKHAKAFAKQRDTTVTQ